FGIHTLVERCTLRICAKFPAMATKRVSPHSIRHYVASRTISGKFGFGPFFARISRFTGYIVLPPSTRLLGATSHERHVIYKQIVASRLQKALRQGHIGYCEKSLREQRYSRYTTGTPVCSPLST